MRKISLYCLNAAMAVFLSGCDAVVLFPSGDIAAQQRDLLVVSTLLMLLIIVPVMYLTVRFAWKYRASNEQAEYEPDWDHSTKLELVIWACPLLIIICLGALTWMGTHLLDPYRPLSRITPAASLKEGLKPLEVQVVALDWKWLFIYPEYGIATVNELAAPVDRPITFRITASSVMNAFYVPALAGMIYAMPGMETKLHAVINKVGDYIGFSSNYSGNGFSHMKFRFSGMEKGVFDAWVAKVKSSPVRLDRDLYLAKLEAPTENEPIAYFSGIEEGLYPAILNDCVDPGKMCMGMMMAIDTKGGLGVEGIRLSSPLPAGSVSDTGKNYVANICKPGEKAAGAAVALQNHIPDSTPLHGYGLATPAYSSAGATGGFLANVFHRIGVEGAASGPLTAQEGR